jgi:S1-C subfamily serine protease
MNCSFGSKLRRASAITALLSVLVVCPRPGHAIADSDQTAAMIAKVSSAVVRVVTVRAPGSPDAPASPDAKIVASASSDRTTTALGSGYIIDPAGQACRP